MKTNFFKLAKKASLSGEHFQHRIGAVLIKKNKVVSIGFNRQKTHPKSPSPFKYLHAEIDCILGVDSDTLMDSELYVYRQTRNNTLGLSKPCKHCLWMLQLAGIKKIHHTSEEGYTTYVF